MDEFCVSCCLSTRYGAIHFLSQPIPGAGKALLLPLFWLCACGAPLEEGGEAAVVPSSVPAGGPPSPQWISADQPIHWNQWTETSFSRAAATNRPVLLYLAAPGCEGLFASSDGALPSVAEERYVSIRVNPFHRPDLARRYAPAGWPALAILRPDGRQVARAVDMPARHVRLFLTRLHSHLQERPEVIERKTASPRGLPLPPGGEGGAREVFEALAAEYDPHHAGFGGAVKAPEALVLQFLLDYYSAVGTVAARTMVDGTLDAMLASPVWDSVAGGVCAYSYTPDWQTPLYEKDAADQAGLLRILGARADDVVEYRRAAEALVGYLERELFDSVAGAFRGRQVRLGAASPGSRWWTDPGLYADRNAMLVLSLLEVAPRLADDRALRAQQMATAAADFLMGPARGVGGQVLHCVGARDSVAGLLEDQMLVSQALRLVARRTGDARYERAGEQAFAFAEANLFDAEAGAFRDRPDPLAPEPLAGSPEWATSYPVRDGAMPAGNALAAAQLCDRGERERASDLVRRAGLREPVGRLHAGYGSALLKCECRSGEEP